MDGCFGLLQNSYAIKTGNHPAGFTETNIETFKRQLKCLVFLMTGAKKFLPQILSITNGRSGSFEQMYKNGLAKMWICL